MSDVLASTALEWFETVHQLGAPVAAFWQPTPAQPGRVSLGDRWYFKQHQAPVILGYGHYLGWERISVASMFQRYGLATGYPSAEKLVTSLRRHNPAFTLQSEVGNVLLSSVVGFPEPKPLADLVPPIRDLDGPFRYVAEGIQHEKLRELGDIQSQGNFVLRDNAAAEVQAVARKRRNGQNAFRLALLRRYGAVCAFTGETLPEALEAAHIQPYVDALSNHIGNGLLLRSDMHSLFDAGILSLTDNFRILVSKRVLGKHGWLDEMDGKAARLQSGNAFPSLEALSFHRRVVFEGGNRV